MVDRHEAARQGRKAMGEFEFRVDRAKNRLYLRLVGFFRSRDVDPAMRKLQAALNDLKAGFDVVTDLSDFVPGSPGAAEALRKGGELIKARGRRNGVRITGGLMTGLMQFQRLLRGVFDDTSIRYAKSLQEADTILDEWAKETADP
jgi:hypothetical protein